MIRALIAAIVLAACAASAPPTPYEAPEYAQDTAPAAEIAIGDTGGMCGGIAGFQCKAGGDYCAMEPTMCVSLADAAGVCTAKPQACTMDYRPVCGCDGQTYANACGAAAAGVSVAANAACAE